MSRPLFISLVLLASACSSDASDTKSGTVNSADWQLTPQIPNAPDDPVVATVNERPVHASCVAIQMGAHKLERMQALDECIDFELLAQAAELAGTHTDPDVQRAAKRELVRNFTNERYDVRGPDDVPEETVRRLWDQINVPRFNHPELRNISYCRIPIPHELGPDSKEYKEAEAFLQAIYENLRDRKNIEKEELYAPCHETYEEAGIPKLVLEVTGLTPRARLLEQFGDVYFAVEEAGMVAPPMYSVYGWDLPIITEIKPAKSTTFEEAEQELREALFNMPVYESAREGLFEKWYAPLAKAYAISVYPERLPAEAPRIGGNPISIPRESPAP